MKHDVFISHSSKDKPIADAICANLEAAGIRCWIAPRDIAPGDDWPRAISSAISQSRIMVLIFSANANSSDQISRELSVAADNNLAIIPFKIENVKPEPGKQYFLSRTHWLDAMNPPTQVQINQLVERVNSFSKGISTSGQNIPVLSPAMSPDFMRPARHKPSWRISTWIWGILILVIVLVGGAASTYLWRQTSKAPLASLTNMPENSATPALELQSVPSPTKTPEISAIPTLNTQAEQARAFAEPILDAITSQKPDFEDDFSKANPAWYINETEANSAIEEGVARLKPSNGSVGISNDTALTGKDFVFQLDARLVSGDTTSQINLDLHNVSGTNKFFLFLHPAVQTWEIAGTWGSNFPLGQLASGANDAVGPIGETIQITIIAQGSRFALYLNQTPMGYFENSNFDNAGRTIIQCQSFSPAVCELDNVKFWNLANVAGLP